MNKLILRILLLCIPIIVVGQNSDSDDKTDKDSWNFDATPYIWFSSITGEVSYLEQSVPVEAEFKDILDQLSFGALVHFEAHKGAWTIMTDLVYMKLKEDGSIRDSSLSTKIEIDQTIWELAGGYRLIKLEDYFTLDGLFGLRYFALKPSLDINQQNVLNKSLDFIDPIIGVRFKSLNGKWINSARIDIGLGSQTTWKLNLLLGYQFSDLFSLYLGYQGYDVNYEGDDSFVYDVYTGGLITGFNFHF